MHLLNEYEYPEKADTLRSGQLLLLLALRRCRPSHWGFCLETHHNSCLKTVDMSFTTFSDRFLFSQKFWFSLSPRSHYIFTKDISISLVLHLNLSLSDV